MLQEQVIGLPVVATNVRAVRDGLCRTGGLNCPTSMATKVSRALEQYTVRS